MKTTPAAMTTVAIFSALTAAADYHARGVKAAETRRANAAADQKAAEARRADYTRRGKKAAITRSLRADSVAPETRDITSETIRRANIRAAARRIHPAASAAALDPSRWVAI